MPRVARETVVYRRQRDGGSSGNALALASGTMTWSNSSPFASLRWHQHYAAGGQRGGPRR